MSEIVPFGFETEYERVPGYGVVAEDSYEEDTQAAFLTDLGVGVALTILVLSCVGCLCTAFLFHAFRQWQARVADARHVECGYDTESLPSYTVVAGLPSYEEAIEQLKRGSIINEATTSDIPNAPAFSRLSVGDLLEIYKHNATKK